MTRIRLLAVGSITVVSITVAAATLAGCGGASPGQTAARDACKAYANTMRHQVTATLERADAIRVAARSAARRAAEADPAWQALQRDIADFYSQQQTLARQQNLSQQTSVNEMNAYFADDRRVHADCTSAGADIGPLQP